MMIDVILCHLGFHKWARSIEPGVRWCHRFCQKRETLKTGDLGVKGDDLKCG